MSRRSRRSRASRSITWIDQTEHYPQLRKLTPDAPTRVQEIFQKPEIRPLYLKEKGELGSLGSRKGSSNLAPTLAYTRGEVNNPPCLSCVSFVGPFRECVSLSGHFDFACTNCAYNGHGDRCSLRPNTGNDNRESHHDPLLDSRRSQPEVDVAVSRQSDRTTTLNASTHQVSNSPINRGSPSPQKLVGSDSKLHHGPSLHKGSLAQKGIRKAAEGVEMEMQKAALLSSELRTTTSTRQAVLLTMGRSDQRDAIISPPTSHHASPLRDVTGQKIVSGSGGAPLMMIQSIQTAEKDAEKPSTILGSAELAFGLQNPQVRIGESTLPSQKRTIEECTPSTHVRPGMDIADSISRKPDESSPKRRKVVVGTRESRGVSSSKGTASGGEAVTQVLPAYEVKRRDGGLSGQEIQGEEKTKQGTTVTYQLQTNVSGRLDTPSTISLAEEPAGPSFTLVPLLSTEFAAAPLKTTSLLHPPRPASANPVDTSTDDKSLTPNSTTNNTAIASHTTNDTPDQSVSDASLSIYQVLLTKALAMTQHQRSEALAALYFQISVLQEANSRVG